MKVCIVGIGMDGGRTLTREAETAIREAELLIGAERILRPFADLGKAQFVSYFSQDIAENIESSDFGSAAVLMSGDCGFFSGTRKLLPLLADHDVRVIAGLSSVSYFCSKIGISYENMKFITLHGRNSNIAVNVRMKRACFFLLGGELTAADVCRRLCDFGLGSVTVHLGADLGYESEHIITASAEELTSCSVRGLAVMITENPEALRFIPSAIPDGEFIRAEIPMTKSEVRGIAVSRLKIAADSVVWDIGCGTGSVSVEAAFRCPDGSVLAFDKKPEAARLTAENARRFGCDNIEVTEGICPESLTDAKTPDQVFIGGTSGNLQEIFECIRGKNPCADIVVTAVSLETLQDAVRCFEMCGTSPEIVQIAATRTRKIGTHTMLRAQNPVFLISGRLS